MKAREWSKRAAEHGDANAQCVLGIIYLTGQEVAQSDATAKEWLTKAAAQGHPHAKATLEDM